MAFDMIDIGLVRGIGTLLVFTAFICVTLWAYSSRRARDFSEAAQLPFADDPKTAVSRSDTP